MIAVIFGVEPNRGAANRNFEIAAALKAGLESIDGFILAYGSRKTGLALTRERLHVPPAQAAASPSAQAADMPTSAAPPTFICRHCGHAMTILQTFMRGELVRAPPPP